MRVLVAYASKHGGTREIAERIADQLRGSGLEAELRPITDVDQASGFDSFVIGSSIYMGHWNKEAVAFVHRNQGLLVGHPIWLFSSGPIGTQERVDLAELDDLKATVEIREHRLFGGVLKPDQMSFAERLMAKAMKVSGDNREWPAIDWWAEEIRTALSTAPATSQA